MKAFPPQTMKQIDSAAVSECNISYKLLMANAAKAVFDTMVKSIDKAFKIAILCGKGNNGGDGYALAALFKEYGCEVFCLNVFDTFPKSQEGYEFANSFATTGKVFTPKNIKTQDILCCDMIFDCIFGTGFCGTVEKDSYVYNLLDQINKESTAIKVAVDIPSGANGTDGRVENIAFCADLTITLAHAKPGIYSYPARHYCGEIIIADIGIPQSISNKFNTDFFVTDDEYISDTIPVRSNDSNKGSFGHLLSLCGSPNMTGAPALAAMGALRSGVGLYTQAADPKTTSILQAKLSEPIFLPIDTTQQSDVEILLERLQKCSAFLIGCGIGKDLHLPKLITRLVRECPCGIILDADGINALSSNINVLKEAKKTPILTPHPLEFSRISGYSVEEINSNRLNLAVDFARQYNTVIVLKGAGTIIASPDGKAFINPTGNSALAKGGTGDVLAGVTASFYAQGFDPFSAAVCAVYLHGKAGDILSDKYSTYGVIASDLPLEIAKLL